MRDNQTIQRQSSYWFALHAARALNLNSIQSERANLLLQMEGSGIELNLKSTNIHTVKTDRSSTYKLCIQLCK